MKQRIKELAEQASRQSPDGYPVTIPYSKDFADKFAELIIEECRSVIVQLYHNTPLELCGPLMTADENIAEHFYGVKE